MREKLKKMSMDWYRPADTYAEVAIALNIAENLPVIPVAEPVIFAGLGNGKRSDAVQASLFDCIHAELLGERDAEKAKVRNRRKNDRKYKLTPKMRKEQKWMRNWNICGKYMNCGWTLVNDAKDAESDVFARKDFITELHQHEDAIAEMYDYLAFAKDHAERAEMLRNKLLDLPVDHGNHSRNFAESIVVEIRYEEIRIKDMDTMAKMILKGECY